MCDLQLQFLEVFWAGIFTAPLACRREFLRFVPVFLAPGIMSSGGRGLGYASIVLVMWRFLPADTRGETPAGRKEMNQRIQ